MAHIQAECLSSTIVSSLSSGTFQHAQTVVCDGEEPEPTGLDVALQALAAGFDPYLVTAEGTEMGHDYWGSRFFRNIASCSD